MRKTIVACTITAIAVGGGTASAAKLITSKDIADGAIQNRDVAAGAISMSRLSPSVRAAVAKAGTPGKDGVSGVNGKDGASGANGLNGADGAAGAAGAAGEMGIRGAQGVQGVQGAQGDKGDKGDAGARGSQGVAGITGATGAKGDTGATGAKGDTGAAGAKGDTGAAGAKGDTGATGATGAKGDTGAAGAKGDTGATGAKGDTGAAGKDGLNSDVPRDVTAAGLRGWTLAPKGDNPDPTDNGTLTFEAAPVASPLGANALKMVTTTGRNVAAYLPLPVGYAAPFQAGSHPKLSELTTAGYTSLSNATPANTIDVSMQFEVLGANVGSATGYATVVYEPYQNGVLANNTFQRHDVRAGKVWTTKVIAGANGECSQATPCSMSRFAELNLGATVQTAKLRIGQNSGLGWEGFVGYVDDVRLGFDGDIVRYDMGA
jgi:hypothetical protein